MKLLVATDFPPDAPGGGPAVVRQMLEGFPGELYWWSGRAGNVRKMVRGTLRDETIGSIDLKEHYCGCPPGKMVPARKLPRLKAWLMEHCWAPRAAHDLERTIWKVRPDCVWAIPHDFSIFVLSRLREKQRAARGEGERIRWHVTIQDFPDIHGHGSWWGAERVRRMARLQEELYAGADTRDATSKPMLEHLWQRTQRPGLQVIHQGLEAEDFDFLTHFKPSSGACDSTIRIAYAGTILVEEEFAFFTEILEKIRQKWLQRSHSSDVENGKLSREIRLELWGAHSYASRPWFKREWMIERGNLPQRKLVEALRACDWGFIPMALSDDDPRYNRFSFPTKFITYLGAGLPIITMGHPESSVMKMAKNYRVGINLDGRREEYDAIEKALIEPHARKIYLPEIIRCARENFDAEVMRRGLLSAICGGEGHQ